MPFLLLVHCDSAAATLLLVPQSGARRIQSAPMGRYVVVAKSVSSAAPLAVFDVLADIATWKDWGPYARTYLESEGEPEPDGLGAVRVYYTWPFNSREQITVFEPPHRFGYRILSGFPVRDYNALVTLEPLADHGTKITWRSEFDGKPRGTGWLMRLALRPYIAFLARKTGKVAAARVAEHSAEPKSSAA